MAADPTPRRVGILVLVAALLATGSLLALGYRWPLRLSEPEVRTRPLEVHSDGYVSSSACQACHPREYATWRASYHRRMTQEASPDSVLARFDGRELAYAGERVRVERRGDQYWVVRRSTSSSADTPAVERRVVMTTGSHHFQAYWLESGESRRIDLFAHAWQVAERRWVPFDSVVLVPPGTRVHGRGSEWNTICVGCHAVRGQPRAMGDRVDTRAAEFGIACEACHGPGGEHVRVNRNPLRRIGLEVRDRPDPTIVNPGRLDPEAQMQVCAQCHSPWTFLGPEDKRRWLERGSSYRPGDPSFFDRVRLLDHNQLAEVTRFWPDGALRVGGREYQDVLASPCFASGEFTCTTCHRMHRGSDDARPLDVWADDQLRPGARTGRACLACHARFADARARARHSHHPAPSPGSACTHCHMPFTSFGLHKATRSHRVSSPTVQESVDLGRPNACNLCHLDRSLSWTARWLEQWYGTAPPPLAERDRQVAASIVWALSGEAGQRGIATWAMGWRPAQQASGRDWMPPILAQGLVDPYDVDRSVAFHSLRQIPGYAGLRYDFAGPVPAREDAARAVLRRWSADPKRHSVGSRLLIDPEGRFDHAAAAQLVRDRDERPIWYPD
ncbi:MAG: multiheme c-type cytochrome [Myxococcota bacterium]